MNWTGESSSLRRADITPYGEQRITEQTVEVSIDSQWGPDPLRDRIEPRIGNGTSDNKVERIGGEISLSVGTNSSHVASLKSSEVLNYQPSSIALVSFFTRKKSSDSFDTGQFYRFGAGNGSNGVFYRAEPDGKIHLYVRDGGSLRDILDSDDVDQSAVWPGSYMPDIDEFLNSGRIYYIIYAYYGAGPIEFGTFKQDKVKPHNLSDREEVFAVYDPVKDSEVDGPFMETGNLRINIELSNNGSISSSGAQCFIGSRHAALFGKRKRLRRGLFEKSDQSSSISIGQSFEPFYALAPKQTFKGRESGLEIQSTSIELSNIGGSDVEIIPAILDRRDVTADFTASRYSDNQTGAEVAIKGVNNGFTTANLSDSILEVQPTARISSNSSSNKTVEGQLDEINTIGFHQVLVFFAKGLGGSTSIRILSAKRQEGW